MAPLPKPSGSMASDARTSLIRTQQPEHRGVLSSSALQARWLTTSTPVASGAHAREPSDADVDAAAALLGYVFEKSPPPPLATSESNTVDEAVGFVSRNSSTSVSSSEPSFDASGSEHVIDSSRPPTPVAVLRDHSCRSDTDEYGSCQIENFGLNVVD